MVSSETGRLEGYSHGAGIKAPVTVATTGSNITLESAQTIDGIAVGSCERVLVKNQTDASENGVYIADSSTWVRAPDCNGAKDLKPGSLVYVTRGTQNGDSFWVPNASSTALDITIGTDDIDWSEVSVTLSNVSAEGQKFVQNTSAIDMRSTLGFPTTSKDNAVLRADSTSGLYQDSSVTIGDDGTLTALAVVVNGTLTTTDVVVNGTLTTTDVVLTSGSTMEMNDNLLSQPRIKDYSEGFYAIGNATSTAITVDISAGNVQSFTMAASATAAITVSNLPSTGAVNLTLFITNGATWELIWPDPTFWGNGSKPSLSTGVDIVALIKPTTGSTWYGFNPTSNMST